MSPCIHCQAMAQEIAELRAALGLNGSVTTQRQIQRAFGLTLAEARLAQALYEAGGKTVPAYTLAQIVVKDEALLEGSDALKVHVCNVRRKLGGECIDTTPGGYAMTQEGRALLFTALKVAA